VDRPEEPEDDEAAREDVLVDLTLTRRSDLT
jgi:hypothetical protein